jgi:hypothetical protein
MARASCARQTLQSGPAEQWIAVLSDTALREAFLRLLRGGVARGAEALEVRGVPKESSVSAMRSNVVTDSRRDAAAIRKAEATEGLFGELTRAHRAPSRRVVARVTHCAPRTRPRSPRALPTPGAPGSRPHPPGVAVVLRVVVVGAHDPELRELLRVHRDLLRAVFMDDVSDVAALLRSEALYRLELFHRSPLLIVVGGHRMIPTATA